MHSRLLTCCLLLWVSAASAAIIEQPLSDPAKEQQARALFSTFKCVVCEGQSLAESDAKLAIQMRARIRRMVNAGETPESVRVFFEQSYGEQILMAPPVAPRTFLLWALPLLLIVIGIWVIRRMTRTDGASHE